MLTLVTTDTAVSVFTFLEATEDAAGVSAFVVKFKLEGEDEVLVVFFSSEEGVSFDLFTEAADAVVFNFEVSCSADFFPAAEVFSVEEGFEAVFFKLGRFDEGGESGGEFGFWLRFCFVVVGKAGAEQEGREEECFGHR